jgi:CheY-like chemotaxis protein
MEALGVLAGSVAHDFNNLLNVINGYSDLILEDLDPDNPIAADLQRIKSVGKQAASLTSQLLAFGRKQLIQPELINLNEVIEDMGLMLHRLIGENIKMTTAAQPDLWLISADPGQIHQIVMNLAINARDAMPQGGHFTIETANVDLDKDFGEHLATPPGSYVRLLISDTGTGMDEATRARLFEPFFTTKEKGKGTGLGLSTVYGIVKQNKGFISVSSEQGKGTAFKIYFPCIEGELLKTSPESHLKQDKIGHETILIAEDDAGLRMLAGRMLRNSGFTVIEAADGDEALNLAKKYEGEIHLIFTDAIMPGMGTRELVEQMKVIHPAIKSLYTSGYTDAVIVQQGVLDKNVAFLQKPYDAASLMKNIRKVLDSDQS